MKKLRIVKSQHMNLVKPKIETYFHVEVKGLLFWKPFFRDVSNKPKYFETEKEAKIALGEYLHRKRIKKTLQKPEIIFWVNENEEYFYDANKPNLQ